MDVLVFLFHFGVNVDVGNMESLVGFICRRDDGVGGSGGVGGLLNPSATHKSYNTNISSCSCTH